MSKMDINSHCGTGRLGRDPELRYTKNNTAVCDCNVCINTGFGKNQKSIWTRLTVWGKQGEFVANNARKGDLLMWSGAQFMAEEFVGNDGTKKRTHFFEVGQSGQVNLMSAPAARQDDSRDDNDRQHENDQSQSGDQW